MKIKPAVRCSLVLLLAALPARASEARGEILVSAAVSLKDVLQYAAPIFEGENPGLKVDFNFGGSGQLKAQIQGGAPVDVFISASAADMDGLEAGELIVEGTRRDAARNRLVLVKGKALKSGLKGVAGLASPGISRIAIGNPATVPAGRYAAEALRKRGLYGAVEARLILAENVRQVLDYAARGEVDAGFVYLTDARVEPRVEIAEVLPASDHAKIVYPCAVLKNAPNPAGAAKFTDFLLSKKGKSAFRRFGFN
ncbi:MAG: molybdate ABC transporter substrate-binding protein [Elusimicrobiales bacterium]|nr:molybdate ABC transporter substrate-binding protein [Elusimicrobiales bacterium]